MYNKSILVGRLTANPELKLTPNKVAVTSFSIAVNRDYKDKNGGYQADFFDIVAWRGTAEFICKYFAKGQAILIEGQLQTRSYTDKQGQKRKVVEVIAQTAHFVGSKQESGVQPPKIDEDFQPMPPSDDDEDFPF